MLKCSETSIEVSVLVCGKNHEPSWMIDKKNLSAYLEHILQSFMLMWQAFQKQKVAQFVYLFIFLCLFLSGKLLYSLSFRVMREIWASSTSLINLLVAFIQQCEWLRSSSSGTHIIQQKLEWMWKRERTAAYWNIKQSSPTIKFKSLYTYWQLWLKFIKSLKINPYLFCCKKML